MRPSAVLQHVQHLASLGLPDGVVIPEILDTIREAVPAAYGSFYWTDRFGTTRDLYAPCSVREEMARHGVDFLSLDQEREPTLQKVVAMGRMVDNASLIAKIFDFSRSVVVYEVMPRASAAMGLDLVVRRDGEARGVLYLNRHVSDPTFTEADRRFLVAAHPYIAHAIGNPDGAMGGEVDPEAEREGSLTVTRTGEIVALAGEAVAILADIPEPRREWRLVGDIVQGHVPGALFPLLDALDATDLGRPAPPARLTIRRRWGEFRARAYSQRSLRGEPSGLVTILLSHHLPRAVRMMRRVAAMPLAPMERRVAFLAGAGKAPAEMAAVLGVGEHTLRSYLKSAYARTGHQGRAALANAVRGS